MVEIKARGEGHKARLTADFHWKLSSVRVIGILRGRWENKSIVANVVGFDRMPDSGSHKATFVWSSEPVLPARQIDTRQRTHSPYLFRLYTGVPYVPRVSTGA